MLNLFKKLLGIHIHEWEMWEFVDANKFVSESSGTVKVVTIQQRKCKTCGKNQIDVFSKEQ
jgi:hypothetical protein